MTHSLDSEAVADYLADHPYFFEDHPDLVPLLKLTSPLGGRTVSLQDRQMEVLREKIKLQELRLAELLRIGHDNDLISEKMQEWMRALLLARNDVDLPHVLVNGLQSTFSVPHATLRIWGAAPEFSHTWFAEPVSDDARLFSNSLTTPFCGTNNDFEAATWFEGAPAVASIAILPLRAETDGEAFGLLVLGSPDPQRFTADMATDFLAQIGASSSAALNCLLA